MLYCTGDTVFFMLHGSVECKAIVDKVHYSSSYQTEAIIIRYTCTMTLVPLVSPIVFLIIASYMFSTELYCVFWLSAYWFRMNAFHFA